MGQKIATGILGTALPVASEPVCSTQDHMRSELCHRGRARHVGREPITMQTRELCPRTQWSSTSSHLLLLWLDISKTSTMSNFIPGSHNWWLKAFKGVKRLPQSKERLQSPLSRKDHQLGSSSFNSELLSRLFRGQEVSSGGGSGGLFGVFPPQ